MLAKCCYIGDHFHGRSGDDNDIEASSLQSGLVMEGSLAALRGEEYSRVLAHEPESADIFRKPGLQ